MNKFDLKEFSFFDCMIAIYDKTGFFYLANEENDLLLMMEKGMITGVSVPIKYFNEQSEQIKTNPEQTIPKRYLEETLSKLYNNGIMNFCSSHIELPNSSFYLLAEAICPSGTKGLDFYNAVVKRELSDLTAGDIIREEHIDRFFDPYIAANKP